MRWLGGKAEELGTEIYPGFSASEVVISFWLLLVFFIYFKIISCFA